MILLPYLEVDTLEAKGPLRPFDLDHLQLAAGKVEGHKEIHPPFAPLRPHGPLEGDQAGDGVGMELQKLT